MEGESQMRHRDWWRIAAMLGPVVGCHPKATQAECQEMASKKADILIAEQGSVANRELLEATLTKACVGNGFTREHVRCVLSAETSAESVACEAKRLGIK
jgi:hypothetical protein